MHLRVLLFFLSSFLIVSCNHLFYYPHKNLIASPEKLNLKYDDLSIKTEDGIDLNAWLIHATNEKPFATILHFHGNGDNISTHFLYFAWLAYMGFDVVEFDYRGYGLSAGEPDRAGLLLDSQAAMQWTQEHARSKNIFIIAQSLGGAVVIPAYVVGKMKNIQAIILESTFASYREIARKKLAHIWLTWPLQWPLGFLISDELSPVDYIKNIDVPLLFIHSKKDPVVPYESGYLLYEAAPMLKEFWQVPWAGHTAAFTTQDNRFRKDLIGYLCHHLKQVNNNCEKMYENYKDPVVDIQ